MSDVDFMPDDDSNFGDEGFRVDFSNVETRNFDPLPPGKYLVAVTDMERFVVASGKNEGAPRVSGEFTVQEPEMGRVRDADSMEWKEVKTAERKLWSNFMPTVATTLFNLKGFLAALGDDVSGSLTFVPEEIMQRPFESRLLVVTVKTKPASKDKNTGTEYDARSEIKSFAPASTWKPRTASGDSSAESLLP
jgi:hypothetical protein